MISVNLFSYCVNRGLPVQPYTVICVSINKLRNTLLGRIRMTKGMKIFIKNLYYFVIVSEPY